MRKKHLIEDPLVIGLMIMACLILLFALPGIHFWKEHKSLPSRQHTFTPLTVSNGPNVFAVGAIGNGIHDDLPAINAAIATAKASGQRYLILPSGTFGISKTLLIPDKFEVAGMGRGDSGGTNTVIQALPTFPIGAAVVSMGDANPSFGVQIQNLTIDGQGRAGSCLENHQAEEQSWGRKLQLANCPGASLSVSTVAAQNSGPFEDLEIYPAATMADTTVNTTCASIQGVIDFRGIIGMTCYGGSGVRPNVGLALDFQGHYSDIHIERVATGILLGDANGSADGTVITNSEFGPNVDTGITISAVGGNQNYTLIGASCAGCSVGLVNDQTMGRLITHTSLGIYAVGDGAGTSKTTITNLQGIH